MKANPSQLTDEEKTARFLVRLACLQNQACGDRIESDQQPHEYSGYSVEMPLLESAVHAPFQVVFGAPRHPGVYDRAAALMTHVAKAHAFGDGNKRTALHLSVTYLRISGITVVPPNYELGAQLATDATRSDISFEEIIKNTRSKFIAWTVGDDISNEHRKYWGNIPPQNNSVSGL